MLSYKFFYDPSMFTVFTVGVRISWKKLCWKGSIVAKMPYCVSYLVYYDNYCVEGGFEKIMTKLRLSLKDNNNNNQLQSKFHLAFI